MTNIFGSRIFGWALYCLLIVGLVWAFWHIIIFKKKSIHYFNSDFITYKVDGKTYFKYKTGEPQPKIEIDIVNIDFLKKILNCRIRVNSYNNLNIRMLHVSSWAWDDFLKKEGLGPMPEVYFIHPTEEEIYNLKSKDINQLSREFQFKVAGDPFLYPFDSYKAEFGILLMNLSGKQQKAAPIKVTTIVENYLPGFYMTDTKDALTFQKEAASSAKEILPDNTFSFKLMREKFIRLFTLYIYSIAFIFLIYIGFRRSIQELLIQSLGYFAALWGIRNIISGKVEIFPTIIDYLTLILFTMLVLIIIGRLLQEYYKQKGEKAGDTN
jgi:hypothetical protein